MPDQLLVPFSEAARKLGVSRNTLRKYVKVREIKAVQIGPRSYIPQAEINRIVNGDAAPAPPVAGAISLALPADNSAIPTWENIAKQEGLSAAERYDALKAAGAPSRVLYEALMDAVGEDLAQSFPR